MKNNSTTGLLILGGAGLLYFMNATKAKAAPVRVTTGSAKPPVDSFDKLFAQRAQQPVYNGSGGGVQAAVDLTGAVGAVWNALRKGVDALRGTPRPPTQFTPYYSTWEDFREAKVQADNDKYGPVDDWYNGGTNSGPEERPGFSSSAYGIPYDSGESIEGIDYGDSNDFDESFESSTGF